MAELTAEPARGHLRAILPKSLFGRTLIIVIAPLLLIQSVLAYVFLERHWDAITRRLCFSLAGDIAFVIDRLETAAPGEQAALFAGAARRMDLRLELLPPGPLPATDEGGRPLLVAVLSSQIAYVLDDPFTIDADIGGDTIRVAVQTPLGVLQVTSPLKRVTSSTVGLLIFWMVGLTLLLIVVAVLFLRNQIRPIHRLAEAAEAFGKGQQVAAFKPSGATEVRRAAAAFIAMRQRIERHIRQRTEMLAGISHDLRTPLTRLRLQLALMGDGPQVAELLRDVVEMAHMVDEFLAFARGEDGEPTAETDLAELLAEVGREAARGSGADITVAPSPPLVVPVRRRTLKRALVNVVENSQRFASEVRLSLATAPRWTELLVDDDGPGIQESDRETAFRPFVRLDQARNPGAGGVGLGLSIARDAVRAHGGDIHLEDSPLGGLRVRLRLPV